MRRKGPNAERKVRQSKGTRQWAPFPTEHFHSYFQFQVKVLELFHFSTLSSGRVVPWSSIIFSHVCANPRAWTRDGGKCKNLMTLGNCHLIQKPMTGSPRLADGEESQALLSTAICNEQRTLIGISQAYL